FISKRRSRGQRHGLLTDSLIRPGAAWQSTWIPCLPGELYPDDSIENSYRVYL
ncbi:hypothetical protein J6590_049481, partial [Homalodisca vitripennis]